MKPLFKNQVESVGRMLNAPCFFDQSEPGTGKTRVQIEMIRRISEADSKHRALVTATLSTTTSAWLNDFREFAPDLTVVVALSPKLPERFNTPADVYITNHDSVKWLADPENKSVLRNTFGGYATIVHDESTVFKHHTSQRSKAAKILAQHFARKRNLSGLADPNGLTDLWHQYFLLDGGKRLGPSFSKFQHTFYSPKKVWVNSSRCVNEWTENPNSARIIAQLTKDITIKHLLSECQDIPENFVYERPMPLPTKLQKLYRKFTQDMVVEIGGQELVALNKAVLRGKLLQFASGSFYNESGGDHTVVDSGRRDFILDLVQEVKHSIVFFLWKHQRDELIDGAKKRGLKFAVYDGETGIAERNRITEQYQNGDLDVIFAYPQAAAHGLTWVRGTRCIWASPTDNYEWWVQGNRRIYRTGQTQRTETIVVYAPDTYDEICLSNLTGKKFRSNLYDDMLAKALAK